MVVIANPVYGWMSGSSTYSCTNANGSYPYQWCPVVVIANPVYGWISGSSTYSCTNANGSYPYQWCPVVVIASPVYGWIRGSAEALAINRANTVFIWYIIFIIIIKII